MVWFAGQRIFSVLIYHFRSPPWVSTFFSRLFHQRESSLGREHMFTVWQIWQPHYCYSVSTSQSVFLGFYPWNGGIMVHNWGRDMRTSTEKEKENERKIRLGALKSSFSHFTTSPKSDEVKVSLLLDGNWLNLANLFFFSFNAFGNQQSWDYLELMSPSSFTSFWRP